MKRHNRPSRAAHLRVIDCQPLPDVKNTAAEWARLLGVSTEKFNTLIWQYIETDYGMMDLLANRRVTAVRVYGYLSRNHPEWAARLLAKLGDCPLTPGEWAEVLGVSEYDMLGLLSNAWHNDGDLESREFLAHPKRKIVPVVFRSYLARHRPEWAERLEARWPRTGAA
jgi:hypothetical protein